MKRYSEFIAGEISYPHARDNKKPLPKFMQLIQGHVLQFVKSLGDKRLTLCFGQKIKLHVHCDSTHPFALSKQKARVTDLEQMEFNRFLLTFDQGQELEVEVLLTKR